VSGSRRRVVAASVNASPPKEEGTSLGVKERWQRIQDEEDDMEISVHGLDGSMGGDGSAEQLQLDRAAARRTRMQRELLEIKAQEPEAHSDPETTSGLADPLPAPRVSLVARVKSALAGPEHAVQHLWSAVVQIGAAAAGAVFFSPDQMRRRLTRARASEERARRAAGALASLPGTLAAAVATTDAEVLHRGAEADALRRLSEAEADGPAKAAKEGEEEASAAAQGSVLSPAGAMRSRLQVRPPVPSRTPPSHALNPTISRRLPSVAGPLPALANKRGLSFNRHPPLCCAGRPRVRPLWCRHAHAAQAEDRPGRRGVRKRAQPSRRGAAGEWVTRHCGPRL
jgi:hypothetical protein